MMTIAEALAFLKQAGHGIVIVKRETGEIVSVIHSESYTPDMKEDWENFLHKLYLEEKTHKAFVGASTTERDIVAFIEKTQILHARRQLERGILYHEYRVFGYTLVFRDQRYLIFDQRTLISAEGALPGRLGSVLDRINGLPAVDLSAGELARMGMETDRVDLVFHDDPNTVHSVKKRVFSNIRAEGHPQAKPGCGEDFPHYVEGKFPVVLL